MLVRIYISVSTAVFSVDIAEYRWRNHRMIKRRIEYLALLLIHRLDVDQTELLVPAGLSSSTHSFEIPLRLLRTEVFPCILSAYR